MNIYENYIETLLESDVEVYIKELSQDRRGMFPLSLRNKKTDEEFANLTYSKNPNITYTRDKDSEDYIYIEWMETNKSERSKGYSAQLIEYLKRKYKDKTVIATSNDMSEKLLKKLGVVVIH